MAKMAERPSSANQQILRLAEAERRHLGHPYLGDEHLLLGVLAHAANPAAAMLTERGFELDAAKSEIARIVAASGPVAQDSRVECQLSITALSSAEPTRPIDCVIPGPIPVHDSFDHLPMITPRSTTPHGLRHQRLDPSPSSLAQFS